MVCTHCKADVPEGAKYCPRCQNLVTKMPIFSQNNSLSTRTKSNRSAILLIVSALVILLAVLGGFLVGRAGDNTSEVHPTPAIQNPAYGIIYDVQSDESKKVFEILAHESDNDVDLKAKTSPLYLMEQGTRQWQLAFDPEEPHETIHDRFTARWLNDDAGRDLLKARQTIDPSKPEYVRESQQRLGAWRNSVMKNPAMSLAYWKDREFRHDVDSFLGEVPELIGNTLGDQCLECLGSGICEMCEGRGWVLDFGRHPCNPKCEECGGTGIAQQ